jgi:hypothetical protein
MPSSADDLHYFPPGRLHNQDGVLLRVIPELGVPWTGVFASEPSGRYKTGVYSCPNPNSFCVVANGAGYMLNANDPMGYEELPISPILTIVPETEAGLLIMANYTDVLAWDDAGRRWLAERVSFDGIKNLEIKSGAVCGMAWSPVDGDYPFALELATGTRRSLGSSSILL